MPSKKKPNVKLLLAAPMIALALVMNSSTAYGEIVVLKKSKPAPVDGYFMDAESYDIMLSQALAYQKTKGSLDAALMENKDLERKANRNTWYFWGGMIVGFGATLAAAHALK